VTAPASAETSRLRLTILLIVVGCLFVALLARLWFLQVINVSAAKQQIETSGIVTIYTPAPRGEILDREGQPLVDNIIVPVIEVQRQDSTDTPMVTRLAALVGMSVKALKVAINNVQYSPLDEVPVYDNATPAQMLYVDEHSALFPGVIATTISQPHVTALGEYAANIVGYVGLIDAAQLKAGAKEGYRPGDLVGQLGAEEQFESELRGKAGVTRIQVNASQQELGPLSSTPPVPGHNVRLSINGPLQKLAVEALRTQEANARKIVDKYATPKINFEAPQGAVVVEDPRNGQVLALASDPSYNPNRFNDGGISEAGYNRIKADDGLVNLPVQGEYAPGSTFKLVTATASLKYGIFSPSKLYDDVGYITIGGKKFSDDNGDGAGWIDLTQAITVSSDNYFNEIGADLWDQRAKYGQDALQNVAKDYGFAKPTGIDLPGEADAGYSSAEIPTPQIIAKEHRQNPKAYPNGIWYTGVSAHEAIGQQLVVTPLQLANAYAAFANGGTLYHPQIALDAKATSGRVVKTYRSTVAGHTPALSPADRSAMVQGFVGVVNNSLGTANIDFAGTPLAGEDIAGKTGTAQVSGNNPTTGLPNQDTAVFTSFAPASSPRYVVDCFIPDSGYGADAAAPVVRILYDQLFGKPLQPVKYAAIDNGLQN
jgi:penicillin-binding protein 2